MRGVCFKLEMRKFKRERKTEEERNLVKTEIGEQDNKREACVKLKRRKLKRGKRKLDRTGIGENKRKVNEMIIKTCVSGK